MTASFLFVLIVILSQISSSASLTLTETLAGANFTNPVLVGDSQNYLSNMALQNYACKTLEGDSIVFPTSAEEVANAVKIANSFNIPFAARVGGYGYSCQRSEGPGMLMDMSKMNAFARHYSLDGTLNSMSVGTGQTWSQILANVRTLDAEENVAVKDQCSFASVAGFHLHDGIHFGGLTEKFGLGSSNLEGLTAVTPSGSIMELTESTCFVDNIDMGYPKICEDTWVGLKNVGSSYGIVTGLNLKLCQRV